MTRIRSVSRPYTLYDALILWDLSRADVVADLRPDLATSWAARYAPSAAGMQLCPALLLCYHVDHTTER